MADALRYRHLFEVIDEIRPKVIMEIGVWNGVHGRRMIKYAQKYNKHIRYYGFDLFEDITNEEIKKENSKSRVTFSDVASNFNSIENATVDLIRGYTHQTLPKFKPLIAPDFIFIDGGHSLETIDNDWLFCSKLMHKKTVVLFDDYYPNRTTVGCKNLIDNLKEFHGYKYDVQLLQPIDYFPQSDRSMLEIQMVQVTLRADEL